MRHTVRTRLLPLALLALLCALAPAQRPPVKDDPAEAARRVARRESLGLALGRAARAREELRLRHFDRVFELADRAVRELEEMGGREYALEAREVLAESALLQGRPAEALRQADALPPRFMVQRFGMTRALALIALGRTAEARAMVLAEVGTPDKPGPFRDGHGVWHFPIDDDASVTALSATAFLIRSAWRYSALNNPEVLDDIKAASSLAPRDAMVRLRLALAQEEVGNPGAARTEYLFARTLPGADARIKAQVWKGVARIDEAVAAKASGTSPKSGG